MRDLDPAFFVHLGDIVYYDKRSAGGDVDARTPELARFHWNRWYGCSDIVRFHNHVPSFFIKDDHDTVTNDSVPGDQVGELSWVKGLAIFREQVPMGHPTYRSRRWSQDLHFWIVEGRDYRSPNDRPDGPDKSLWGEEQKAWFKEEVLASDAPIKILFSPTPIVGPDRKNKRDNLSNANWTHEGDEIRKFCVRTRSSSFAVIATGNTTASTMRPECMSFPPGPPPKTTPAVSAWTCERMSTSTSAIEGGFLSGEINPREDNPRLVMRHHRTDGSVAYEYTFSQ